MLRLHGGAQESAGGGGGGASMEDVFQLPVAPATPLRWAALPAACPACQHPFPVPDNHTCPHQSWLQRKTNTHCPVVWRGRRRQRGRRRRCRSSVSTHAQQLISAPKHQNWLTNQQLRRCMGGRRGVGLLPAGLAGGKRRGDATLAVGGCRWQLGPLHPGRQLGQCPVGEFFRCNWCPSGLSGAQIQI